MSFGRSRLSRDAVTECVPQEEGIVFRGRAEERLTESPLGAYLEQLAEEGYAQHGPDSWYCVEWSRLYRLLEDEGHRSSISILGLPAVGDWVPRLVSRSTPSDSSFQVAIASWLSPSANVERASARRIGACIEVDGARWLLSEQAWRLTCLVTALAREGASLSAEGRLSAAGCIRQLAKSIGAALDDYLERTEIVAARCMSLQFTKQEVLGAPVIEIIPQLDGAPQEWLRSFDRYETVRGRYDVSLPNGGIAHVVTTPELREALEPIKRMPKRRIASEQALLFLYNPCAVLGDSATAVVDLEDFESRRREAGVVFKQLQVAPELSPSQATLEVLLVDPEGREQDQSIRLSREQAASLLRASARSRQRGLPLFSWEGEEIELGGSTEEALRAVEKWLVASDISTLAIRYAEVFDLEAYSDRVVGFDGTTITVPYVARKDAGTGWIPENIERGVIRAVAGGVEPHRLTLSPEQLEELAALCRKAKEEGSSTVPVPGTDLRVHVAEAEHWLTVFQADEERRRTKKRLPTEEKDPSGANRAPILKILHNIERLDYGVAPLIAQLEPGAEPELPNALKQGVELLPHQRVGVAWLQHRFRQKEQGVTGCLLADDMGLGKTLQVLCLLAWYREVFPNPRPCLVVAPVALLENWKAEVEKFLDGTQGHVLALYGEDLRQVRATPESIDPELQALGLRKFLRPGFEADSSIVLTTYETLRDYQFSLARVHWGIVVCDEAQKIKTPAALVTRAAKALQADFRVACTGTPVENSLADLWCLFDFFQPGLLGSLNEFTSKFRRQIETRAAGHDQLVERLRKAIEPWVLRRLKADVATLPPKYERDHSEADPRCMQLRMSPLQRQLYSEVISRFRAAMRHRERGAGILAILNTLRMICSHPLSVSHEDAELLPIEVHIEHSPKLAWLLDRLTAIRARGEKAIVFTEYRDIQRLLQRAIMYRFDYVAPIVNGSSTVDPRSDASRQRIIDRFQSAPGFGVIILSTTAVGFGLNVQAANHVIHFTRPWNPAKEDQATDRTYRIGQTKPVHVYCPTVIAEDFETFDLRVDSLLAEKRSLSRDMLAGVQEITLNDFEGL